MFALCPTRWCCRGLFRIPMGVWGLRMRVRLNANLTTRSEARDNPAGRFQLSCVRSTANAIYIPTQIEITTEIEIARNVDIRGGRQINPVTLHFNFVAVGVLNCDITLPVK